MAKKTEEFKVEKTHTVQEAPAAHSTAAPARPHIIHRVRQHPLFLDALFVLLVIAVLIGTVYWLDMQGKIYIEKAEISAPIISMGPSAPGILDKLYVEEGDEVSQGQKLFEVDGQVVKSGTRGIVIYVQNTPGQFVTSQNVIVKLIDPREMRVVGRVQEDKGLSSLKPGQKVIFTVDAFGPKEYQGTLESVASASRQSDIVFSISNKREEREFDVKVEFDTQAYSELKNGMSAKMWIYK